MKVRWAFFWASQNLDLKSIAPNVAAAWHRHRSKQIAFDPRAMSAPQVPLENAIFSSFSQCKEAIVSKENGSSKRLQHTASNGKENKRGNREKSIVFRYDSLLPQKRAPPRILQAYGQERHCRIGNRVIRCKADRPATVLSFCFLLFMKTWLGSVFKINLNVYFSYSRWKNLVHRMLS